MIETVNVVHTPVSERERKRQRRNSSTSGSSSLTIWDTPKTPLDVNSDGDRQAQSHSSARLQHRNHDDKDMRKMSQSFDQYLNSPTKPEGGIQDEVPDWLSDTVATGRSVKDR